MEIYKKENKAAKDKLKKLNTMGDKSSKSISKKSKKTTSAPEEKLGLANRKKEEAENNERLNLMIGQLNATSSAISS